MAETFKQWMLNQFTPEELQDIATHGVQGGFSGLIYYHETVPLYEKHKKEIWEMLMEDAEAIGHDNPYQLIATFGGAKNVGDYDQHANLLAWYAAERIAQEEANRGGEDE